MGGVRGKMGPGGGPEHSCRGQRGTKGKEKAGDPVTICSADCIKGSNMRPKMLEGRDLTEEQIKSEYRGEKGGDEGLGVPRSCTGGAFGKTHQGKAMISQMGRNTETVKSCEIIVKRGQEGDDAKWP